MGIAGLVNVLDPDRVVVGGGVSDAGDLLLASCSRCASDAAVEGVERRPEMPIVAAALGADSGAIGAATMVLERIDGATP